MQKYKLAKVFLSFILILSLLVSIGTPVGAIEPSYKYSEDSTQVLLRLSEGLPVGKYTLKYDNEDGVLSEYADICTLEVVSEGEAVVYTGFIKENVAPSEATTIGVYTSSGGRIDELSLEGLENAVEKKQYSFGAISDTHIGAKTSKEDLQKALTFFEQDKDVEFTTICGDLSLGGSLDNLNAYKSIVNTYSTKPVYAISGNHETNAPFAPLEMKGLQPYTEQDLYYSFEKGDDVYVMVGMHSSRAGLEFAEGELQWLYETLEKNRNKRCFLFMHLFPKDGSGDAVDLDLEGDMLSNTQGKVFYSLLSHYNNVIYFHGHSHQAFKVQEQHNMNTYDKIFGCHSVHIPSLAYPKYVSNGSLVADYNASEGYVVDVYENSIVLRGRDFVNEKYLPIAQYSLDTTIKPVQANTYYDSTGTIMNSNSNVLSAGSSWYQGNFNKNEITKIVISDGYSGGYDEKWDATVSQSGEVVVYRKGTVLYVVGNENGVVANTNCSAM
ncbi:MAG: metallophosphoesterase, partial [Acutalibacteraceae bacterium]|nr:metallophosphoesterase [Acutalibacteraceae bacterium]